MSKEAIKTILQRLENIKDEADSELVPISVTYRPGDQLAMAEEAILNTKIKLDRTRYMVELLISDIKKDNKEINH